MGSLLRTRITLVLFLFAASASSAPAQTLSIPASVQAYAGAGANGPANVVSNAVPFKPGVVSAPGSVRVLDGSTEIPVSARTLATWPADGSIRSLLLQFVAPVAKAYTIQVGTPRTTADRAFIPVTWDLPTRIFTLSAAYLSDSLIVGEQTPLGQSGFPAWDQKQVAEYTKIATVGIAACANDDQYYDATTTTYQLYARTGTLAYLVNARRWALHHRRDQIYLSGANIGHGRCAGVNNTRYTFPEGLIQDFFMFGDEEARNVSALIVDNFYMTHADSSYYKAPNTRGFWTEREAAFALIGILAHYEGTGNTAYLNRVRDRVASLHRMQVDNGRRAWVHNLYDPDPSEGCAQTDYGSSPWMSGLLLEGVVTYHRLTGDPIARDSILMAVDDLRAHYVATGAYAGASLVYLGCSRYVDGMPDLDNLIAHAFGYAYKLTADPTYRALGTSVFNTSVTSGISWTHKQYDQMFRSSGHFPAYLKAVGPTPSPPRSPTNLRITS
jgi:hypothetical protein